MNGSVAIRQISFEAVSHLTVNRSGRCGKCHRILTDPESVRLGFGPVCRGYKRAGSMEDGKMDRDLCKNDDFSDQFDNDIPFRVTLVLRRKAEWKSDQVGGAITNVPHLVTHHSPSGFEWGYGGSGPADLALNVCQLYLNIIDYTGQKTKCHDGQCWTMAWILHQDFKRDFIALVPKSGMSIPFTTIEAWFKDHMTAELRKMCSSNDESEDDEVLL